MPMLSRNTDAALLVLRVIAGTIFMAHGAQKLFTFMIPRVTRAMAGWGVPLPGLAAPLVTAVELLGGLALVIGLLTRPALSRSPSRAASRPPFSGSQST